MGLLGSPLLFSCSLRLKGRGELRLGELGWCEFWGGVVWRQRRGAEWVYRLEKQQLMEECALGEHSLCFEQAQFSLAAVVREYRQFMRLMHLPHGACRVFYLRREQTLPSTSSFERLYEDEMMQIDEEVKVKGKSKEESHYLP